MQVARYRTFAIVAAMIACGAANAWAQRPLVLEANMKVLRCTMPDETYRFAGSSAPGQLFLAGEPVDIKLVLAKGNDNGEVKDFAIEIQEISTRDPEAKIKEVFTDTAGNAPLIGLEGKAVTQPISVAFAGDATSIVDVKGLPVPERFGTYALVLTRGDKRQFLATVCRLPKPREDGRIDNVPIFGEGQMMSPAEMIETRAKQYARMGVRGWRSELSWSEDESGKYNWENYDKLFNAAEAAGCRIMVTLGGHPTWSRPFGEPTPASGWRPDSGGYWGTGDWCCKPEHYDRYGKWITAFCERYHKGGKGALWGLENYNEPWEGGGISGWARDMTQYRALQRTIGESARKVSPEIVLLAASSIMNTEDKLYSDGSNEFDKYVDIFTDHYVVPPMCYGPLVAKSRGKQSMETETWFVNSEYLLPQGVAQFMACGQERISPGHPRVLFDSVPGTQDDYFIPTPVVAATAAFNYFATGKSFEKVVFKEHLPWVFQFGKDDDNDALFVLFGQLVPIAGSDPKDRLWTQVDSAAGGTMTIDNADGLLKFFDLAGNSTHVGEASVTLPMSIYPTYIKSSKGPKAAAERLAAAQIEGKRPVEILPRDSASSLKAGGVLNVELHNCLNREIEGAFSLASGGGLIFEQAFHGVKLAAGERKIIPLAVSKAEGEKATAFACTFKFESSAGNAEYTEVMNSAIIPKFTATIDGSLDDWKDIAGINVVGKAQKAEITELLRRPWLEIRDAEPDGNFAEFKLAWDENNLYIAARVNDPTPQDTGLAPMAGRNEDLYFHTKESDGQSPYKEFLQKFPKRSFEEVSYVWRYSPEKPDHPSLPTIPFRRDRLHIALDVTEGWHDLKSTTDRVPLGMHAVPDTDYEYAIYQTSGGSEMWRYLAPGVPRINDWPRQVRGERTTGTVPGGKSVVKLDGSMYIYEAAIPKEELADLKLAAGTTVGIMLRAGNNNGPHVDFGADKAVTKKNGLTLHPYWERVPNAGVRWTLVD